MKRYLIFCVTVAFLISSYFLHSMGQPQESILFQALLQRDHNEACRLIRIQEINVNEIDSEYGASLLMLACYAGLHDVTQAMLSRSDILVNHQDKSGLTALMHAIQGQQVQTIKLLLACPNIDLSLTDTSGHNALYWAEQSYNSEVITLLKEAEKKASSWSGYCTIS